MPKTNVLLATMAIASLSLPAAAGSWPNLPARKAPPKAVQPAAQSLEAPASLGEYRYFTSEEYRGRRAFSSAGTPEAKTASADGFEFVDGDTGWQLAQHKYVRRGGRFMHSEECDHMKRLAAAPASPAEVDAERRFSPGS